MNKEPFQILDFSVMAAVGPVCALVLDGQRVNRMIESLLNQGYTVRLNFNGVKLVTPRFYKAMLGELQATFPEDRIQPTNLPTDPITT